VTARADREVEAGRQLTAFAELFELMSSMTGETDQVLEAIAARAGLLCDADTAFIYLVDGDVIRIAAGVGGKPEHWAFERAHPNQIDRRTLSGRVALERRAIHIPDVLADAEYDWGGQKVGGYRTLLGVPLIAGEEFYGLIGLARYEVRPFDEGEIELVGLFGSQASIAIRIARFVTESHVAVEREQAIQEVLGAMSRSGFDLAETLQTVIDHAVELSRAEQGDIERRDGDVFRTVAMSSTDGDVQHLRDTVGPRAYLPDRKTAIGRAFMERRPIHIIDVLADPDYDFPEVQQALGYRTILSVPMMKDDQLAGVLSVWRTEVRPFTEREIAIVATFAEQALIAIENVDLYATVQRQREELARFAPQVADMLSSEEGERLLAGHRREISVLYSDLRGFTAFAEAAEPEEVLGVLRQYHEVAGALTVANGGTVEHFAGDGLMVFFNDPVPLDDHTASALRTAVEMRERFEALAAGWRRRGYELGLGIGVTTGYASIGRIGFEGRYDYAAVGNAVIQAARLSSAAAAGEILLSQRAYAEVETIVEADEVPGLELKGFSRAVTAYRVSALHETATLRGSKGDV
jgi:class 3 adenylate cyclase